MQRRQKKQFSLTLVMRIFLVVVVVSALGVFAGSVMKYNAILEEQRVLESQLAEYREEKEELELLLGSEMDYEYIVRIAREQLGLFFPDEEIYYNDRNQK